MKNLDEIRERYMRDAVPMRLGGLAANLARVNSFSKNQSNREAVNNLLEESKYFIEWTAHETEIEIAAELIEMQIQLARWQQRLRNIWEDQTHRAMIGEQARVWSNKLLERSGLLDK